MNEIRIISHPIIGDINGDHISHAVTNKGEILASHISSPGWVEEDMVRPSKLAEYNKYFPDGYYVKFNNVIIYHKNQQNDTK